MNHKENLNDPEQPSGVLGSDPIQSTENDADQAAEATVSRKAKLDILFGLGGITVSVFALIEALKMPVEELYNCKWYTAPAMLPIICSVIVGGLCLVLVFQSFRRCGGIQMMDLFHMQLEEPDYIRSIRQYQDCSIHVHLADSDRQYPGHGQLPFDEIIKIFSELGYQGAFTAEILQLPDQRSAAENTMRHMAPIFSQHYGRP